MPKVYFYTDAEYQVECQNGDANLYAERLNTGIDYIALTLFRQTHPLSLTGFDVRQSNVVEGELTAKALTNKTASIRLSGIFYLEPKSAYVSLILDTGVLWQIAARKPIRGVKRVDYTDYYGKKSVMSLQVVANKSLKDIRSNVGVLGASSDGATKVKEVTAIKLVKKTANTFTVKGRFIYAQCAEVSSDLVRRVKSGHLAGGELEDTLQSSPSFFSLYGAEQNDLEVELEGVFRYATKTGGDLNWITESSTRTDSPTEIYLKESLDLSNLPKTKHYVLTVDHLYGSEEYAFKGRFLADKFFAKRIKLRASHNMVLTEVIQISYKGASITEDTEQEGKSIYVMQKGALKKVSE